MSELSERELLLLSNYLYLDKSTEYGTVNDLIESCRDSGGNISEEAVAQLGIGGCMSVEEGCDLLRELDASSDDFKSLNVSRSINEGGIRAICFTMPDDTSNATVVFRGTGGSYEAWADNVRGEYMQDTKMQKLADDFVRYDCGVYDNITVTGHSKGGNMAQYVTVTNPDRVGRCLSFDGQGLGNESVSFYEPQISKVSGRIKSVSAHNDYVNILLNCIAGECVYVSNKRTDAVGRHSSYSLLKSCEFDGDGNIINATKQEPLMKGLSGMGRGITGFMDSLPQNGNRSVSELLASSAAAVFSDEHDSEYEKDRIAESVEGLKGYITGLLGFGAGEYDDVSVVTDSVYVDAAGLTQAFARLNGMCGEMRKIAEELGSLKYRIDYKAASRLAVDIVIRKQENLIRREEIKLNDYARALEEISRIYSGCEDELSECIRGAVL